MKTDEDKMAKIVRATVDQGGGVERVEEGLRRYVCIYRHNWI